jgi:hypothetical protein
MLVRSVVVVVASCAFLFACSGASSSGLFDSDTSGTSPQADGGQKKPTPSKKESDKDGGSADAAPSSVTDAGGSANPAATCALTNLELPKDACYGCWTGACCADWKTCDGNPSCVKLANCIGKCPSNDTDCIEDCAFLYPNGKEMMSVLVACGQKTCDAKCG